MDYVIDLPQPTAVPDWECFLLPVPLLKSLNHLTIHERCRDHLEHVLVPAAQRTEEAIAQELTRRRVCAVSWRWSSTPPPTLDRLTDWSPMSDLQLSRLKELLRRSQDNYVWVDWACVPQLSGDTMKFINASYDIYSQAQRVVFIPRIKELKRRGWPRLSSQEARHAIGIARTAAEGVFSSGAFSEGLNRVLLDSGRTGRLELQLQLLQGRTDEARAQLESVVSMLLRLLTGEDLVYPTFDYYARAWTLAERLAAFKPSRETPVRLGEMQTAGDALLYAMASFWRDVQRHAGAYVRTGRPSWEVSELSMAVYMRGVDPSEEGVREMWDDMNHMVQLAPTTLGIASETAALAVICVEWLLHEKTGAGDDLGRLAAAFLGECAAYTSIAVAGSSMQEQADPVWFRKYMHFQAGSVYGSTVTRDLILAVYRSCGLQERETADEAVESCLREVFGDSVYSSDGDSKPDIDRLCREAMRHEELHTHMPSTREDGSILSASDFSQMMPPARQAVPITVAVWHEWLTQSGVVVSWWFSKLDQAMPAGPTEYIDVEQLYCDDATKLTGLSLDEVFKFAVTVVYKLHRLDDSKWRLLHLSFLRRAGRCGEGLSPYRNRQALTLKTLLDRDIIRDGRVEADLISAWNQRLLKSIDQAVHDHWLQCVSSTDVVVIS